jgi:hypothetical protein
VVATGHVTTAGDHTHDPADVEGLGATLDGLASAVHSHDYAATGHSHDYAATGHSHALPATGALTFATNMAAGTTGAPVAQEIVPGWVALSGRIRATTAGSANQEIGTIPDGWRPAAEERPTVRFIGSGASSGTVTITAAGLMTYNTALPNAGEVPLSGILYRKA